jgi:hypothetical protein
MKRERKSKKILNELKENSSFVFLATLIAVLLIFVIKIYFKKEVNESFFYITHTIHIFIFAIIGSALFFKHKGKTISALVIGLIVSIVLASLSDIIFPWIGSILFNLNSSFNLPLIKYPFIIISTGLLGSLVGIITKFTRIPFLIQIFVSVFAILFYLLSFTQTTNSLVIILFTIIIFIGALITCCIRDIVLPLIFVKK